MISISKSQIRRQRKRRRHKQKKTNVKLKKKLFGHLFMSPCCYCKKVFIVENLTIEHIIPLCLGGTNDPINIALACGPCNHERGKEAWLKRQNVNKKYYEQHHQRYRNQNRESIIQEIWASLMHRQGDGV